jgi:hypothetical protein
MQKSWNIQDYNQGSSTKNGAFRGSRILGNVMGPRFMVSGCITDSAIYSRVVHSVDSSIRDTRL